MNLPDGATPDPDHPGWYSWGDPPPERFAATIGRLLFRPDGPGQGRCRIAPSEALLNIGGSIHGGAAMTFIDMALFVGGRCAGMASGHFVTLDCHTQFIARARAGPPLDAVVRLVGETRGGLVFLSGHCEQEGAATHSFSGTLKRLRQSA